MSDTSSNNQNSTISGASSKPIIVMKFGGTSVATEEGHSSIVERTRDAQSNGKAPVLVVSAMGRKGAPYATDTLLSLVEKSPCSVHETDVLMSVGETLSSIVLASKLREAGILACALSGGEAGIVTDGIDGCANITEIHTNTLLSLIESGTVPVVAGFQGIDEAGRITTLGRGGSDTTACALGVALNAESVDIYTDVDGIMTADPRIIDDAVVLERITSDELFQMATSGSKIVHSPAAELALHSGILMKVKNTFSDAPGTDVVDITAYRPSTMATAVSNSGGVARIRVKLPYVKDNPAEHMAIQTRVYRVMADAGISLDMFTPMNDRMVFSIKHVDVAEAERVLSKMNFEYAVRDNLAKVTLVGSGMHGIPGVVARLAEYLSAAHVDILQVSDSHTTISVLVREEDVPAAVEALHRGFDL